MEVKKINIETLKSLLHEAKSKYDADNLEGALAEIKKLKDYSETKGITSELAQGLKLEAIIFQSRSNYAEAMRAALEAKELFAASQDIEGEADCLNILGGVYNFLGDLNNRLKCNLACLELRKKLNNERAVLSSLNNTGDTYLSLKDFPNAHNYFEQCLKFEDVSENIKAIVKCNIAEVYFFQNDFENAVRYNKKGLQHAKNSEYHQIIIAAHLLDGQIALKRKKYDEGLESLELAREVLKVKDSKEQEILILKFISDCYFGKDDFELAYKFLDKHLALFHQVNDQNNSQKMKKIEFDFQFKTITRETNEIKEKNVMLLKAFQQIEEQSEEIQLKNKAITDSIHYAKRIQYAILPEEAKIKRYLPSAFIFYHPKDIVSGDFYWVEKVDGKVVFAVIDCTGHGVPGAFVSLIANNTLNKIILEEQITTPGEILNTMNNRITEFFKRSDEQLRDGVDMGICTWDNTSRELQFAGAFNSLFMFSEGDLLEVKGNRESIGASIYHHEKEFKNYVFNLEQETKIYLSSDGFPDQFGGSKGKKLKWKGFRELLKNMGPEPIKSQSEMVHQFYTNWTGDFEQLDDICFMGVEL